MIWQCCARPPARPCSPLLWLHVPIAVAIGMARGDGWLVPALLMVAMALAATLSWRDVRATGSRPA